MSPVRRYLATTTLVGLALLYAPPASAHCDTLSGPVVKAAQAALEAKDLRPVLKWVKPDAEPELRSAFEKTLSVRGQGAAARELADRYFFETLVRLHRAGEGAPYTGLKAEADDPQGFIAASDRALDGGSLGPLQSLVADKIAAGLRERHARVIEARRHADESVEAGRKYVEAYVEYVHFVEALQAASSQGAPAEGAHRHGQ
jgi:hypothetical protein